MTMTFMMLFHVPSALGGQSLDYRRSTPKRAIFMKVKEKFHNYLQKPTFYNKFVFLLVFNITLLFYSNLSIMIIFSQFILLFKLNKIILTALTFPWWCCQQGRQWGWPPSAMYLCPARGASHTWAKKLLGIVFWTCQLVLLFVFDIKALFGVQFWVRISDPRTNWALFHQIRIA